MIQGLPPPLRNDQDISLSTESFIFGASLQETTPVLPKSPSPDEPSTSAASRKTSVVGRLIPAGTGMPT